MMWVRGSRYDYDHWAQNGAEGWSYAEVLPYFMRMEDSRAKNVDLGMLPFISKILNLRVLL